MEVETDCWSVPALSSLAVGASPSAIVGMWLSMHGHQSATMNPVNKSQNLVPLLFLLLGYPFVRSTTLCLLLVTSQLNYSSYVSKVGPILDDVVEPG